MPATWLSRPSTTPSPSSTRSPRNPTVTALSSCSSSATISPSGLHRMVVKPRAHPRATLLRMERSQLRPRRRPPRPLKLPLRLGARRPLEALHRPLSAAYRDGGKQGEIISSKHGFLLCDFQFFESEIFIMLHMRMVESKKVSGQLNRLHSEGFVFSGHHSVT